MSAPSISAATWAMTVSKPCPIEAPPVITSISPVVSTWMRTPSAGPRPAFSTNMASPTPTISPFARRAASSRLSSTQFDVVQRRVEQRMIVAGVEVDFLAERLERTLERHLVDPNRVEPPHLDRIELQLMRDGVHQPLTHEGGLEAPRRAISRGRRLVGEAEMADRAIGAGHAIRPGQHAAGHHGDAGGVGANVGAVVVMDVVVDGEDLALVGAGRLDVVVLVARMVGGDQVLAPVLDPFHRRARTASRRRRPGCPRDRVRRGCRSRRRRGTRGTAPTPARG